MQTGWQGLSSQAVWQVAGTQQTGRHSRVRGQVGGQHGAGQQQGLQQLGSQQLSGQSSSCQEEPVQELGKQTLLPQLLSLEQTETAEFVGTQDPEKQVFAMVGAAAWGSVGQQRGAKGCEGGAAAGRSWSLTGPVLVGLSTCVCVCVSVCVYVSSAWGCV